jgi:hypothetical protein
MKREIESILPDLNIAIHAVWVILSLLIITFLVILFLVPDMVLLKMSPTCVSVTMLHKECAFCGMTRAFISISHGELKQAMEFNRISSCLFFAFVGNTMTFLFYFSKKLWHARNFKFR